MAVTKIYERGVLRVIKAKGNKGFTLVEMAIVLAIIAVTLGSGVLLFNEYIKSSKIEETKTKMDEILLSIKRYANKYGTLPCPADPTIKVTDSDFGLGDCASVNVVKSAEVSNKVLIGGLPVYDLNIYPTLALDGWGNRITYIIRENSATAPGIDNTPNEITICNYGGGSCYSDVIVIVISHGENGYGAWNVSGVRKDPTGGNGKEDYNADPDRNKYTSAPVASYDDIVYFRTAAQLKDENFE